MSDGTSIARATCETNAPEGVSPTTFTLDERVSDSSTFDRETYFGSESNVYCGALHVNARLRRVQLILPQGTPPRLVDCLRSRAQAAIEDPSSEPAHQELVTSSSSLDRQYPEHDGAVRCDDSDCMDAFHFTDGTRKFFHHHAKLGAELGCIINVERYGSGRWFVEIDSMQEVSPSKALKIAKAIERAAAMAVHLNKLRPAKSA